MTDFIALFNTAKKGVVKIDFRIGNRSIGGGSGFLSEHFLITNNHVYATCLTINQNASVHFRIFNGVDYSSYSLSAMDFQKLFVRGADQNSYDYAILDVRSIPIFHSAYKFTLRLAPDLLEGTPVAFLGFPFSKDNITCHAGYISSIYTRDGIQILQIDGSINGGNSGGPLIDTVNGHVIGLITRAEKGYLVQSFEQLIQSLDENVRILSASGLPEITLGGIGIVDSTRKSQMIMKEIAQNLHRSANVGIGYAFSVAPVLNDLHALVS